MIYSNPPVWLYQRPRILNILHAAGLANPHSQMNAIEKACLERSAKGKSKALEIGTYMGVTATIIADAMTAGGRLYCVDPFEKKNDQQNPGLTMALRSLKRKKLLPKVEFLLGFSNEKRIIEMIPEGLDFILVDGDHSYDGLKNDWEIVKRKLAPGGIVCLHDTTIPAEEPYRDFGSVSYYNDVVKHDADFRHVETVYSMNVLQRR